MKEVILVTGTAGFIGSHLVERLLCVGYLVMSIEKSAPLFVQWYLENGG